ncbi:hypothetical protein Z043_123570, partial [Scleropages formosus]
WGSSEQLDLLELIGVPLPPSVSFTAGFEGFPAYSFGPDANVGRLTKTFVPDPFYRDFAVIVTARPASSRGGVLFAIADAFQKMVYLGVALTPVEDSTQRVLLYYSEPGSSRSREAASFKVPNLTGRWSRFTLTVEEGEVRLHMDCEEFHVAALRRGPRPLRFESASGIFVGNAGGTGLESFVVSGPSRASVRVNFLRRPGISFQGGLRLDTLAPRESLLLAVYGMRKVIVRERNTGARGIVVQAGRSRSAYYFLDLVRICPCFAFQTQLQGGHFERQPPDRPKRPETFPLLMDRLQNGLQYFLGLRNRISVVPGASGVGLSTTQGPVHEALDVFIAVSWKLQFSCKKCGLKHLLSP